jgi:acyl-CoA reductase-like NAD-dependent aldehyde dehydrogenase
VWCNSSLQVFRENAEELRLIVLAELSCSTTWADINVNDTIALAEHAATLASSSVFSEKVPNVRNPSSHATVNVVPLGVVLGIAPWNAPAILGLRAIAAPVMAGNCVIFKGSEYSPRTHHFIAKAFRTAGFPPGVVNFVMHEPKHAASLFETIISHSKVRKCNFTGSTAVGRHIAMKAACYLKPVLLELGGKNFAIVLDDADLDEASEDIIIGAFPNVLPPHI